MKFKFKFQLQAEGSYGNKDPLTGQWTGMIKDLRTQKADMAVIDMSITSVRQTAVDFTMPYMNTGYLWLISTNRLENSDDEDKCEPARIQECKKEGKARAFLPHLSQQWPPLPRTQLLIAAN